MAKMVVATMHTNERFITVKKKGESFQKNLTEREFSCVDANLDNCF